MSDAEVLVASAASIFGPLALLFALAVRDFRRRCPRDFQPYRPKH
jgi:hypothetical protein